MGDGAISSLNHKAFDALISKLSAYRHTNRTATDDQHRYFLHAG